MSEMRVQQIDAILPAEMAQRSEEIGVRKAGMDAGSTFVLAVLAGAFIGLGAVFSNLVASTVGGSFPLGVTRLIAGCAFSLGLVLVVVGGAELFTGNNLIVMAWASGRIGGRDVLRNWGIVYLGNFVGALATAFLVVASGHYAMGSGAVGRSLLETANAKASLSFQSAVLLGVLANALLCLAVWLTYSCRTTTDKILVIVPPIAAFVACGFEHSIANMYIIPAGLFLQGALPTPHSDLGHLTWANFVWRNLIPVTLGNVLGGSVLVGIVYWFVYLRRRANVANHRDEAAARSMP